MFRCPGFDDGGARSRRRTSTIRQPRRHTFSGMDETQNLAVQALRELLDNPDRDDWDELLAANRALIKAIAKNKPMSRNNARIVAEYLREAGWRERAIGAAAKLGADLEYSGGTVAKSSEERHETVFSDLLATVSVTYRRCWDPIFRSGISFRALEP